MKKIFLLTLALTFLSGCKGSKKNESSSFPRESPLSFDRRIDKDEIKPQAPQSNPYTFAIQSVEFEPDFPTANDDLLARPLLGNEEENVEFTFQWFVNDREIKNEISNTFGKGNFKKRDAIRCSVTARMGSEGSLPFTSKSIVIVNSPPQIDISPMPPFNFPGLLFYQIQATDADNDPLIYELIIPTDLGITIDSASGLLQWNVTEEMMATLPESVEIRFRAIDSDNKAAEGFLKLDLARTRKAT